MRLLFRYVWALPYTLVGLLFVPFVLLSGGRARVFRGVLEMDGPLPAFWLRHIVLVKDAAAITIGHVVLGRDAKALSRTRAHERAHVRQFELWGPAFVPLYLLAGLWALVTRQGAYRGNYFEREAREIANR
jgi:hypothetical protein